MLALPRMPLPAHILKNAEPFFGCSFGNCRIATDAQLGKHGLTALTNGRDIWVDPSVWTFSPTDQKRVLGHELTHIVQQRQGRAHGMRRRALARKYRLSLEKEADLVGEAFAKGKRSPHSVDGANLRVSSPVWQPLVSVAGAKLDSLDQLPASVLQVTSFIEGGLAWLSWAMGEPQSRFDFPNALSLVTEIQNGLHGEGLILVPEWELLIHPLALLSISDLGIEALCATLKEGSDNSVVQLEADRALQTHGYFRQNQLAVVGTFLEQVGLSSAPLFQALTLNDQIAIYQSISNPAGPWSLQADFQKEAAAYASAYSSSPISFADLYAFYATLSLSQDFRKMAPAERARYAQGRSDAIAVALRNQMRAAVIGEVFVPEAVQNLLRAWFSAGNGLGFARVSEAVARLSENSQIAKASGDGLLSEVRDYLQAAREVVQMGNVSPPRVSQNGQFLFYAFRKLQQTVHLRVERSSGCVTLADSEGASQTSPQGHQPHREQVGAFQ